MMLEKLFKLENIKYVISVDDCFAEPEEKSLRDELLLDAISSFETVKPYFIKFGKEDDVDEIQVILDFEADARDDIKSLIETLAIEEVKECLQAIHSGRDNSDSSKEKNGIMEFLETLKGDGIIKQYVTIPSTHEAENFDIEANGMVDGAILWLIDKSFSKVGESDTAGIEFAKNKIEQSQITNNYIFMLTTIGGDSDKEDDIADAFDKILVDFDAKNASLIYYINKNYIAEKNNDCIAKSLSYGFKRKQCYKLIDDYADCLQSSCEKTVEKLRQIKQNTLNYVFTRRVQEKGESHFDFFHRLVQIFHEDEYGSLLATKISDIYSKINHYQNLCNDIPQFEEYTLDVQENLAEVRKIELFDMHVNEKFREVSTGDIFRFKDDYYILVTQSCDTYLRKNGKRKLDNAVLLKILDSSDVKFKYELSCFCAFDDLFKSASIIFQDNCIIPFALLDLCVANKDGRASISIDMFDNKKSLDIYFTSNYKMRYEILIRLFAEVYQNKIMFEKFVDQDDKNTDIDKIKKAYTYLLNLDGILKDFIIEDSLMVYPIQRIARLNEHYTVELLNEYGHVLSRVGGPFDFMQEKKTSTKKHSSGNK